MHARARDLVNQNFRGEMCLWDASPHLHLVVLAAVTLSNTSTPMIRHLTLMSVTRHWLPAIDALDAARVERLVHEQRSFVIQRVRRSPERIADASDPCLLPHLRQPSRQSSP